MISRLGSVTTKSTRIVSQERRLEWLCDCLAVIRGRVEAQSGQMDRQRVDGLHADLHAIHKHLSEIKAEVSRENHGPGEGGALIVIADVSAHEDLIIARERLDAIGALSYSLTSGANEATAPAREALRLYERAVSHLRVVLTLSRRAA